MSRHAAGRACAALLAVGLLLSGCGEPAAPGDAARIDARLVADLRPAQAAEAGRLVDAFGFELFARLADGRRNTIISPLSVDVLLSLVLAGAGGDTAAEMAKVLHAAGSRDTRVGALLGKLGGTDQVTLSTDDAVWAGPGAPVEKNYLDHVRRTFGATVEQGDLAAPETAEAIDAWVRKNTGGRIPAIAADLGLPSRDALLVLLNAVYFHADWATRFDPADTRPLPFTRADGTRVEVPTMHLGEQRFDYTKQDGFEMLRLPYGDGRFGMEILLPDQGDTLTGLLRSLTESRWRAAVAGLSSRSVEELALPRFELSWTGVLNDPLRQLGMPTVFDPGRADLRPMTPRQAWLDKVVHKTYIRVDERGTEAAAVTGGSVQVLSAVTPTVFRVDRPFAFTISDRQTGTILFLGAVTDPRA